MVRGSEEAFRSDGPASASFHSHDNKLSITQNIGVLIGSLKVYAVHTYGAIGCLWTPKPRRLPHQKSLSPFQTQFNLNRNITWRMVRGSEEAFMSDGPASGSNKPCSSFCACGFRREGSGGAGPGCMIDLTRPPKCIKSRLDLEPFPLAAASNSRVSP